MMNVRKSKYERGQAIVLIAAMMIGMIAMVGLAVDGGGLYFLNRDLQNAVDSAVIAATYAKCTGGDVIFAGEQAAADNGFVEGDTAIDVDVQDAPAGLTIPAGADINDYVRVRISAEKPSFFIQVVNDDALIVEASGVGYCKESLSNSSGRAVFAGCEGPANGVKINASSDCSGEIVGGIHSNSGATSNGGLCVEGEVSTAGDGSALSGTANGEPLPGAADQGVPAKDFPVFWAIDDFNEAGDLYPSVVTPYGPENYVNLSGSQTLALNGHLGLETPGLDATIEPVLLFVDGNLTLKADNGVPAGTILYLTIVATGKIDIKGSFNEIELYNAGDHPDFPVDDNPFQHLSVFSDFYEDVGTCNATSSAQALNFSGNNIWWQGILYAPNGAVAASVSGGHAPVFGGIFAQTVSLTVSDTKIVFDPDWLPPDPPEIGIAD